MTNVMLGSITFRALGIHARRNLDFLLYEHGSHGGRENGNLTAPYLQLETWGATPADIRKGFAELDVCGFVDVTVQGLRQSGGGAPSRYALTWLPTQFGKPFANPPTQRWQGVLEHLNSIGVGSVVDAKKWVRDEIKGRFSGRGKR
jgi:hypothetical protein